jgi:hypothetical protein
MNHISPGHPNHSSQMMGPHVAIDAMHRAHPWQAYTRTPVTLNASLNVMSSSHPGTPPSTHRGVTAVAATLAVIVAAVAASAAAIGIPIAAIPAACSCSTPAGAIPPRVVLLLLPAGGGWGWWWEAHLALLDLHVCLSIRPSDCITSGPGGNIHGNGRG